MELLEDGTYCVADVQRGQLSPAGVENLILETAEADGKGVPIRFEQERGASGKSLIDGFKRKLPGHSVKGKQETGIKEVRAQPLSAKAEAGGVVLLAGAWNDDFIEEAVVFPHGGNDDQVDAASGGFQDLQRGGKVAVW
jgi:predicted phage terminase large subunit-like protein